MIPQDNKEETFEDYSFEQLRLKKKIYLDKIREIEEDSVILGLSRKWGIDLYEVIGYSMFIVLAIFLILIIYFLFIPMLINKEYPPNIFGGMLMPSMFILMIILVGLSFLMGTNQPRANYQKKVREIDRVLKIKKELEGDRTKSDEESEGSMKYREPLDDEDEMLEYKGSFKYDLNKAQASKELAKDVVREIVGFLNKSGGTLAIGITDDKKIIGIANDLKLYQNSWDKFNLDIVSHITRHVDSPVIDLITIRPVQAGDKKICEIQIKQSPKPVWYRENNKNHFYVREHNSKRLYDSKEVLDYISRHWPDFMQKKR